MDVSGSFVFCICDDSIDFKEIEANLPINATEIIKNGEMLGKLKSIKSPCDIWAYETIIENVEDIFKELSLLLDNFMQYRNFIKELPDKYESVVINCYLRVDYVLIGFQLSKDIIAKLNKLGLSLDFHILPFKAV